MRRTPDCRRSMAKSVWPAVAVILCLSAVASTEEPTARRELPPPAKPRAVAGYGALPLHFEPNQGQTAQSVRFLTRGSGYGLFLTATESVLVLQKPAEARPGSGVAVLRMKLLGANASPTLEGKEPLPGKSNYFLGNNPKEWRTDVPHVARVEYQHVYPGVGLTFHGNQGQIEYDFVVSPSGDPRQIRLGIDGAEDVHVDAEGNLVLKVPGGEVVERAPVVYQEFGAGRKTVAGRFVLKSRDEVGFEVGPYDVNRPIVIDPVLVYSSYLGGSATSGFSIATDASGNAYVTGATLSTNFPTVNALQPTSGGLQDAFVVKVNAAGSALLYSTYLGGSNFEIGLSIAVDASGNAYVIGNTGSNNFPTANPLQSTNGGATDAFVAKLNAAGSALVYSTYVGGSGTDNGRGITVDKGGNAYITGGTSSSNFPTANPLQAARSGSGDAFVAKLNAAGSAFVYSTYLGGSSGELGYGIAVDAGGNAYVTGTTSSSNFPTVNPLQATNHGLDETFVAKLNPTGSALMYSTYLGGNGNDAAQGIAVDASGNATLTGYTNSTDFPTANPLQATYGGGFFDAFVTKLNAAGSAFVYSTYLGGSENDQAFGVAVDPAGNAAVTGSTLSTNFPTADPLQAASGGSRDAFVTKLKATGSGFIYSTYLGGSATDGGAGIALDASGSAFVTGDTSSTDFPTLNPLQPSTGGTSAFVSRVGAPVPGDFDGDLRTDIVWRHQSTGQNLVWFMNGPKLMGGGFLDTVEDLDWRIVATADFNADGKPDILWRNQASDGILPGGIVAWFMNGTARAGTTLVGVVDDPGWEIVAAADFNGDGHPDILWRNAVTGDNIVWFMDGTTLTGGALLTPVSDPNWRIAAAADFTGDDKPDILWRNRSTGDNVVWFMDGTTLTGGAFLTSVTDQNWQIVAAADFSSDNAPDILWRNTVTGENVIWFMDGTTSLTGAFLTPVPDTNWKVVGPK